MKATLCIPARFGSTRLPGKPLANIAGKPLILHVCERAAAIKGAADCVVLTDDQRIFSVVKDAGFHCAMTSEQCQTGTERIINYLPNSDADAFINIQGDELLLNPEHVDALIEEFKAGDFAMATLAHYQNDETVIRSATTAKIVVDHHHNALYFSRSPIPLQQNGDISPKTLVQIGVYAYQRETLEKLVHLKPGPLEQCEKLEQLRALEHHIPVHITIVDSHQSLSVDTPEDLAKAQQLLKA